MYRCSERNCLQHGWIWGNLRWRQFSRLLADQCPNFSFISTASLLLAHIWDFEKKKNHSWTAGTQLRYQNMIWSLEDHSEHLPKLAIIKYKCHFLIFFTLWGEFLMVVKQQRFELHTVSHLQMIIFKSGHVLYSFITLLQSEIWQLY